MLLTITTTHQPATDLGHLLRKNPARVQSFPLSYGQAHVFYPEASEERCTMALLLEIDPVGLVRNRRGPAGEARTLEQYVNDRPYVASSFLSVAIAEIFGSALSGKSKDRPDLVDMAIPLVATVSVMSCREGEAFLRRLFEPLGYTVTTTAHALDEKFSDWGASPYFTIRLEGTTPLRTLLAHLYVLVPVLDNDKHYWVGDDEVDKLLRHGEGWLAVHPERDQIARRYLKYRRDLMSTALERLASDDTSEPDGRDLQQSREECHTEDSRTLHEQRLEAVAEALERSGARRVLDLGCGEGKLIRVLLKVKQFEVIIGMDVAHRSIGIAAERLHLDDLPESQKDRVQLLHGSLMYRDQRLADYEAAAVVEVIEHLDAPRLSAFERVLFEFARPNTVVLTTPNADYNVKWPTLPAGQFRHKDHRFELTRAAFQDWSRTIGHRFGYSVRIAPVGPEDPELGAPTQMAVFTLSKDGSSG